MFSVTISGFEKELAKIKSLPKRLKDDLATEVEAASNEWVALAQKDAPADVSRLRQSIRANRIGDTTYKIEVGAEYGIYLETGTKGNYRPIPGTEAYVSQFKGRQAGTWKEFIRNIVRWVRRKGISGTYSVKTRKRTGNRLNQFAEDYQVAFLIARSILKKGIKAQPYFFKQQNIVVPKMIERVKAKLATYD